MFLEGGNGTQKAHDLRGGVCDGDPGDGNSSPSAGGSGLRQSANDPTVEHGDNGRVLERLDEPSSRGDTHMIEDSDGVPSTLRSDVVDLDGYVGKRGTVYIAGNSGEDSDRVLNVVQVGPPREFQLVFCYRESPLAETLPTSGGFPYRCWPP